MVVNVHFAKTQLSKLLREVALGHEVVIARNGQPLAKLVPISNQAPERHPEMAKGLIRFVADWDSAETNAAVADLLAGQADRPGRRRRK
jgi:prevent-host-death family protein